MKAPAFCIDKCKYSEGGWGGRIYCDKVGRELTDYKKRPAWCPLLKGDKK